MYISMGTRPTIFSTLWGNAEADRGHPMFFVVIEPLYNYILFSFPRYNTSARSYAYKQVFLVIEWTGHCHFVGIEDYMNNI